MSYDELYRELGARRDRALAMGGQAKLDRRRNAGLLNARERIDYLFDKDSFLESGMFAAAARPEEISRILEESVKGNFTTARGILDKLLIDDGLSGVDIIRQMHREVFKLNVPPLKLLSALLGGEWRAEQCNGRNCNNPCDVSESHLSRLPYLPYTNVSG